MKKIIASVTALTFLSTTNLSIIACGKDEYLNLKNDEIFDRPNYPGKLIDFSLMFMFGLPEKEKPWWGPDSFKSWGWDLKDRKKIILDTHAGNIAIPKDKWEYWEITIQKTKNKGVFVSNYIKSNEPIK